MMATTESIQMAGSYLLEKQGADRLVDFPLTWFKMLTTKRGPLLETCNLGNEYVWQKIPTNPFW